MIQYAYLLRVRNQLPASCYIFMSNALLHREEETYPIRIPTYIYITESAPWIGFLAHAAAPTAHHLIEEPHAPLAEHLLHAVTLVQRLHRRLHVEQKALTVRCANLSPQQKE